MTPKDEPLTGPVADVVAALGAFRAATVPEAAPALQALFSASAVVTAPPAVTTTRRSPVSTPKRLFGVPSKIAAGVLGALLAGSLGAGAMTGTIQLTSSEDEVSTEVVTDPAPAVEDTAADVEDAPDADEADDADEAAEVEDAADVEDDDAAKEVGDPATAPVPTSVSEAAHNHQFDEACGNHGAYVSHFARTGEEPECATAARTAEAAAPAADAEATALSATSADADGSDDGEATMTKPGRGEGGKAKAAERKSAAKSKAKGKSGR